MRTDRLGVLLDQFDKARRGGPGAAGGARRRGVPVGAGAGCWSFRRRGEAITPRAFGPGAWVIDLGAPDIPASEYAEVARQAADGMSVDKIAVDWSVSVARVEEVLAHTGEPEPDVAPVTTIAWRLGHLHYQLRRLVGVDLRRTAAASPREMVDFSPPPRWRWNGSGPVIDRWRDSVAAVTEEQLDTVGFSQYPYGSDPDDPYVTVLARGQPRIHPPHGGDRPAPRPLARPRGASTLVPHQARFAPLAALARTLGALPESPGRTTTSGFRAPCDRTRQDASLPGEPCPVRH